ncbi:MAG: polyprenyl diphosphate synthase [Patescibacteria group bacterium]|jgi:undecaprenyl diphosphate synthase
MSDNQSMAIPNHIGFIMDGNRRWAKEHGLSTFEGHQNGYKKIRSVLDWCINRGIYVVTVFAFSTENWNRAKDEVSYLMELMHWAIKNELQELQKQKVKVNFLGRLDGLPIKLQKAMTDLVEKTKNNSRAVLNLAVNYGGRAEIIDAVKKIAIDNPKLTDVQERDINKFLYASSVPDPDLIIRTSGEKRLSGFLLWEAAYAELFFTKKKWPEFSELDLDEAVKDFGKRKRNFGV